MLALTLTTSQVDGLGVVAFVLMLVVFVMERRPSATHDGRYFGARSTIATAAAFFNYLKHDVFWAWLAGVAAVVCFIVGWVEWREYVGKTRSFD